MSEYVAEGSVCTYRTDRMPSETETRRLACLQRYQVLDSPREEAFDRITRMVARLLDMPIVLVSLVDFDRQWFKSHFGLEVRETPRDISFCNHTIAQPDVFVVEDAHADVRFAGNPLVRGEPKIRFYAGAPLHVGEGLNLGSLCVIDRKPRRLTPDQLELLRDFAALVVDALENREATKRAREAETLLNDAIESLSDGFVVYDAEDRLILCNQRYREMYETTGDEIVPGRTFEEMIRAGIAKGQYPAAEPNPEDWLQRRLAAHREPGPPVEQELPGERWVRIEERRTGSGGLVGFRVDITEMKRQQRKLEALAQNLEVQLSRAEEANRAKMQFLASVSHELRTPLNAIIGFSDVLRGELFGPLVVPKYREYAGDVHTSAQHLLSLVDDILDMAKLSSGKFVLSVEAFDLKSALEEAKKVVASSAQEKGLRIETKHRSADLAVLADERALRQILFNLLSNATKFTPDGGQIRVGTWRAGQRALIEIADTGVGIPADVLPTLGQPFQRVGNVMTSSASGSGLGLAISKALVEAMGGALSIASAPGQGTTVVVSLPVADAAVQAEGPASPLPRTSVSSASR